MLGSRRRYPKIEESVNGTSNGLEEDKSNDDDSNNNSTVLIDEIYTEAQLLPCEPEKKQLLIMFNNMRADSYFCDITFICQGAIFNCHKVVVSGWSRWLRSLLLESSNEENIAVDFFEPSAFGAVVDYMYGVPLTINIDNADSIIKVVRRLEMQKLEQQCWRFLMTIIDPETNCEKLHELADRYDCPPLKLAAWRILQETKPGYGSSPNATKLLKGTSKAQLEAMQNMIGFTGMTGPGEPGFSSMVTVSKAEAEYPGAGNDGEGNDHAEGDEIDNEEDDRQDRPSHNKRSSMPSVFGDDEDDEVGSEQDDDNSEVQSDAEHGILYRKRGARRKTDDKLLYSDPDQLDAMATATDVIKAWASRLKRVYETCAAEAEAAEYVDDSDGFRLPADSSNVRLNTTRRARRGDRSVGVETASGFRGEHSAGVSPPPPKGRKPNPRAFAGRKSPAAKSSADSRLAVDVLPLPADGNKRSVEWKEELRRFYIAVNMPEKVPGIPKVLELWKDKEEQMISSLLEKYVSIIPASMAEHLEQLLSVLETHTESSFVNKKSPSPNKRSANKSRKSPRTQI